MAIIDFLKKQFIDIIEWTDDSRDTLSYRFPDEDKEIKTGAQLIVRPGQEALFIDQGRVAELFYAPFAQQQHDAQHHRDRPFPLRLRLGNLRHRAFERQQRKSVVLLGRAR